MFEDTSAGNIKMIISVISVGTIPEKEGILGNTFNALRNIFIERGCPHSMSAANDNEDKNDHNGRCL